MAKTYQEQINSAAAALSAARSALREKIATYPTPIAGCDEQFNRLLGDRIRISRALAALSDEPFIATPRMLTPNSAVESR